MPQTIQDLGSESFDPLRSGIVPLDRATGAIRWRDAAAPPLENALGGFAGSLALDGDRLIAAGFDGNLITLPARD